MKIFKNIILWIVVAFLAFCLLGSLLYGTEALLAIVLLSVLIIAIVYYIFKKPQIQKKFRTIGVMVLMFFASLMNIGGIGTNNTDIEVENNSSAKQANAVITRSESKNTTESIFEEDSTIEQLEDTTNDSASITQNITNTTVKIENTTKATVETTRNTTVNTTKNTTEQRVNITTNITENITNTIVNSTIDTTRNTTNTTMAIVQNTTNTTMNTTQNTTVQQTQQQTTTEEPTPVIETIQEPATETIVEEGFVYWVDSGSVYHSRLTCPALSNSINVHSGPLSQCPPGRRHCKRC